jgi:hypothetical protein
MTYTFNTIIKQGETHRIAFRFMNSIRSTRLIEPGATKIHVTPMVETLPSGFTLSFDIGSGRVIDLVTSAAIDLDDTEIPINTYTCKVRIPASTRAQTTPRTLVDTTWRGQVRTAYESATPLLTYSLNLIGGATGVVQGEISATATAAATPNAIFSDIPQNRQLQDAFDPTIWAAAYYWDWESVSTVDGTVKRELQGRAWITKEATK